LLAGTPSRGALPWGTAPASAEATAGKRDELMAAIAIKAAAIMNNEQKERRHLDGVNVDVGFSFVIIEFLPVR